jgi:hypothetical protein
VALSKQRFDFLLAFVRPLPVHALSCFILRRAAKLKKCVDSYRRSAIALINGGMQSAVKYFLESIYDVPDDLILKYMSTNAKQRKEVLSLLVQHGITMDELQAKAAQLESGGIQMFDRLAAARENGRRMLLKEAQRSTRRHDLDGTAE